MRKSSAGSPFDQIAAQAPSAITPARSGKPREEGDAGGIIEQVGKGTIDGLKLAWLGLEEAFHSGTGHVLSETYMTGRLFEGMSHEEAVSADMARQKATRVVLEKADSVAEDIGQDVGEFISYFIPVATGLNAAKIGARGAAALHQIGVGSRTAAVVGAVAEGEMAALVAENLTFTPYEARLSNLIEKVPGLENPITQFLQADPADGEAMARLKQNLEGLGLGLLVAPV